MNTLPKMVSAFRFFSLVHLTTLFLRLLDLYSNACNRMNTVKCTRVLGDGVKLDNGLSLLRLI